jgi:hypothetical protein
MDVQRTRGIAAQDADTAVEQSARPDLRTRGDTFNDVVVVHHVRVLDSVLHTIYIMQAVTEQEALAALDDEYSLLDRFIASLEPEQLLIPGGCIGWTNAALLYHMLLDAQRALVTFSSPSSGPTTSDWVNYWRSFQADDPDARDHMRFVVISAAAHGDPSTIGWRWRETAGAALRRAREAGVIDFVTTQGHVLATPDFVATLVVEATIHHVDLTKNLSGPEPAGHAVALTTRTLDGLYDGPRPEGWDDLTYIRKLTGREPLDPSERAVLGGAADRLPVFS